jgi:hypothetical protein
MLLQPSPCRWRQHGPPKCCYPTTNQDLALHLHLRENLKFRSAISEYSGTSTTYVYSVLIINTYEFLNNRMFLSRVRDPWLRRNKHILPPCYRNTHVAQPVQWLGKGLDDRALQGHEFFSQQRFQTGFGAHTASYLMGTRGLFLRGKTVGAWSWSLTFI